MRKQASCRWRRVTWAGYGAVGQWSRCCVNSASHRWAWISVSISPDKKIVQTTLTKQYWCDTRLVCIENTNTHIHKSSCELSMEISFKLRNESSFRVLHKLNSEWIIHRTYMVLLGLISENEQEALPHFIAFICFYLGGFCSDFNRNFDIIMQPTEIRYKLWK